MIFEGAYGTFGSVGAVFFWGNTLKFDLIPEKGIFKILGTFVVQDVQIRWVTLMKEGFMCLFPGIADAGRFAIGNSNSVNGVGILMIENKDVVVAATRRYGEATGLIRIRFEKTLVIKEHDGDSMRAWGEVGLEILGFFIKVGGMVKGKVFFFGGGRKEIRRQRASSGTDVPGFLILMTEYGGDRCGKMLADELGCQTRESGKVATTNCT